MDICGHFESVLERDSLFDLIGEEQSAKCEIKFEKTNK